MIISALISDIMGGCPDFDSSCDKNNIGANVSIGEAVCDL